MKILKERSLVDTIPPALFAELSTQVHAQENWVKAALFNVHMNGANVSQCLLLWIQRGELGMNLEGYGKNSAFIVCNWCKHGCSE